MPENVITHTPVPLPRSTLHRMVGLVRLLHGLAHLPAYRALVYPMVPGSARFDPGHDAVMMGYDFHLTADGPRLIEVNTNAGGGLFAVQAACPQLSASEPLPDKLKLRLLQTFAAEFSSFSGGDRPKPRRIAILDEAPPTQFLYPEMVAFADLFEAWGVNAKVVEPAALEMTAEGVCLDGERIDLVYNRHCDFYLETTALAGLRAAYLARAVCLTPNPHAYGLLGDKRRLVLWSTGEALDALDLSAAERRLCLDLVPPTELLGKLDRDEVWAGRKQSVFKPATHYGSKGVLLGEKISRKRFDELPPDETLVQELVPPSLTEVPEFGPMKTDYRLYAYRDRILGVTARLYRGQVTNLRTPGGGFAPVVLV